MYESEHFSTVYLVWELQSDFNPRATWYVMACGRVLSSASICLISSFSFE